jgi:general nucleoside transport system permease protein
MAPAPAPTPAGQPAIISRPGFWTRARKAGAVLVVLGVGAAILFGALAKSGVDARFTWGTTTKGHGISIPAVGGAVGFGVLCALCGAALLAGVGERWLRWLGTLGGFGFVMSFLCWQIGGNTAPLGSITAGTVLVAIPLVFGALGGVIGERSGVVNVAIEGQILLGAFAGALVGSLGSSAWAGLIGSALAGALIGALLAVLAIRYLVDQVVLGVVLNLLVTGLTSFLYLRLMEPNSAKYNDPPRFHTWAIPGLSKIPLIGPALFNGNVLLYIAIALVVLTHIGLFHTRWGLRTRAVGEHPTAADTVGIRVRGVRYRNVIIAGAIAGLGGAFLTVGGNGQFNIGMSSGKGFIALAAVIFGRWSPLGATMAALLFGFTGELAQLLSVLNSQIPNEWLSMLPYVATIVAVAGLVGRVRAPAADGRPYVKG